MSVNHCEECLERLPGLLEGSLHPDESRVVSSHLESCAECRREYRWLSTLVNDLERMGDDILQGAPEVDLVAAVLAGAEEIDAVAATPIPFVPPRRQGMRRAALAAGWLAMAASVALVIWLGLRGYEAPGSQVAQTGTEPAGSSVTAPANRDPQVLREQVKVERQKLDEALQRIRAVSKPEQPPVPAPSEETKALTPDDILRVRREAITSPDAWSQLLNWATLSPEEAEKVVQAEDANDLAIIGAARSLDDAEAAATLMRVVGKYPENPYARFALALETGVGNPAMAHTDAATVAEKAKLREEGFSQIAALKSLDPENAIPYLMEAEERLRAGDLAGGLALLQQAMELPRAHTYTSLEAQYNEQALIASGMDPETARTVTALTAGADAHSFLYSLSDVLLEYGRTYAAQNNLDAARQVFEAVQRFGEQVEESASYSQELMAGLEIQAEAGSELEAIYGAMGSSDALAALSSQMQELTEGILQFREFSESLNALFNMDLSDWAGIIGSILLSGDLNLGDLLP